MTILLRLLLVMVCKLSQCLMMSLVVADTVQMGKEELEFLGHRNVTNLKTFQKQILKLF